jgi:DNA-binding winged helix-turn-helix (wHTH) protein
MIRRAREYYEFGPFRVDAAERVLLHDGEVVPLTPKVFDTLLVLVENSGHTLTKSEMMNLVWPDATVEESNLTTNISVLRKAMGERSDRHQYIETIPWQGYRFVARSGKCRMNPRFDRGGDDQLTVVIDKSNRQSTRFRSLILINAQYRRSAVGLNQDSANLETEPSGDSGSRNAC